MNDTRYATVETLDMRYSQGAFDVFFGGTDMRHYIGRIAHGYSGKYYAIARAKVLGPDVDNLGDALAQMLDAINPISVRE